MDPYIKVIESKKKKKKKSESESYRNEVNSLVLYSSLSCTLHPTVLDGLGSVETTPGRLDLLNKSKGFMIALSNLTITNANRTVAQWCHASQWKLAATDNYIFGLCPT